MSFLIGNGAIKTYPGRVLTAQEFSIMMDRMSIIHSGIIDGCTIVYSSGSYAIESGWVGVRGRLVRIEQSSFQIPSSGTTKWDVVVKVNLGETTEPASIYCYEDGTTLTDTEDFNTNNNGIAYCVIAEIDTTSPTNPVITQTLYPERGTTVSYTLAAASWNSDKEYTISHPLITQTSDQMIVPAANIAEDQLAALQRANIQEKSQSNGSLVLKAYGVVPTIDCSIRIKYYGG